MRSGNEDIVIDSSSIMKRSRSSRRSKQRRINKANRAAAEKARQESSSNTEDVVVEESSVKITEIINESSDSEIQSESKGIVSEVENDTKTPRVSETPFERKAKKKEALMQYFLPVYHNPRFLEVISEESSDASDRDSKVSCQEVEFTEIPTHSENIIGDTNVELVFLQSASSNETTDSDEDESNTQQNENDVEEDSLEEYYVHQNGFVGESNVQEGVVNTQGDFFEHNGNINENVPGNRENVAFEIKNNDNTHEKLSSEHDAQENVSQEHNTQENVLPEDNAQESILLEDNSEHNVYRKAADHSVQEHVLSEHNGDNNVHEHNAHQKVECEDNVFQESKTDTRSEINQSYEVHENVHLERNVHKKVSFEHSVNKKVILEDNVDHNVKRNNLKVNENISQECNIDQNVSSELKNVSIHAENTLFEQERNVLNKETDEMNGPENLPEDTPLNILRKITKTSALSPPRSPSLSSNGSCSSRGTSLCTARYNPSIGDIASLAKDEELAQASLNFKQPARLRELCLNFLLSQPFGADVLKELANVSKVIDEFTSSLPSKVITSLLKDNVKQRQLTQLANKLFNIPATIKMSATITETEPKDSKEDDLYLYYEENEKSRLQAKELSEWLELARNKSVSETNLTKIGVNQTKKQPRANYSRRASLPNNFYQQQLLLIQEKEREIQRQLEELEEEKRKLLSAQFTPDDYIISSKGDIAIYNEKKKPFNTTATPTEAEVFRQQMYDEYMQQLAERDDRRMNKVIKLSAPRPSEHSPKESKFETIHPTDIEDEFMEQVKKRKLGGGVGDAVDSDEISSGIFDSDSEPIIILDGSSVSCTKVLPRHIQEFAEGECVCLFELSEAGNK